MSMTNAEHQAAWRARRRAELEELRGVVHAPPGVGRIIIDSTMSPYEICEKLNDLGYFSPMDTKSDAEFLADESQARLLAASILHYCTGSPEPDGFYDERPPHGLTPDERAAWDAERAAERAAREAGAESYRVKCKAEEEWFAAHPEKAAAMPAWIKAHPDATQEQFDAWLNEPEVVTA